MTTEKKVENLAIKVLGTTPEKFKQVMEEGQFIVKADGETPYFWSDKWNCRLVTVFDIKDGDYQVNTFL